MFDLLPIVFSDGRCQYHSHSCHHCQHKRYIMISQVLVGNTASREGWLVGSDIPFPHSAHCLSETFEISKQFNSWLATVIILFTSVFGKFEVKRKVEPLWMKLEITLSMSLFFKCCDVTNIIFFHVRFSTWRVCLDRMMSNLPIGSVTMSCT